MSLSDLDRIDQAFSALSEKGYSVSTTEDCSSCALNSFSNNKFVYYNQQDTEPLVEGMLPMGHSFNIGWGEDGLLSEICDELRKQGFLVQMPETSLMKISIR
jgi:hypothetical protein